MSHCEQVDGIQQPDKETEGYVFNHMMLRIKDPKRSLEFYSKVMGMRMVKKFPNQKAMVCRLKIGCATAVRNHYRYSCMASQSAPKDCILM